MLSTNRGARSLAEPTAAPGRRISSASSAWTAVAVTAANSMASVGSTANDAASRIAGTAVARLTRYPGWVSRPAKVVTSGRSIRLAWIAGNKVSTVARTSRSTGSARPRCQASSTVTIVSSNRLTALVSRAVSSTIDSSTATSRSSRARIGSARRVKSSIAGDRTWTASGLAVLVTSRRSSRSGSQPPSCQ